MAPTICSDKKRQLRPSMKDMRARARNAPSNLANNTNAVSTIVNYVAKGSLNSRTSGTLRMRAATSLNTAESSEAESHMSRNSDRLEQADDLASSANISDNVVSSSTFGVEHNENNTLSTSSLPSHYSPTARTATPVSSIGSPYQYSDESMDADLEDAEVHSINSAHRARSEVSSDEENDDGRSDNLSRHRLSRQTVFNAPALCDKKQLQCNSQNYSDMCELKNTEGLLAIAIKTIKLVKRNQMLQRRLTQLQLETSEFIQSVMANPENRHFREKIHQSQKEQIHHH